MLIPERNWSAKQNKNRSSLSNGTVESNGALAVFVASSHWYRRFLIGLHIRLRSQRGDTHLRLTGHLIETLLRMSHEWRMTIWSWRRRRTLTTSRMSSLAVENGTFCPSSRGSNPAAAHGLRTAQKNNSHSYTYDYFLRRSSFLQRTFLDRAC